MCDETSAKELKRLDEQEFLEIIKRSKKDISENKTLSHEEAKRRILYLESSSSKLDKD